MNDITKAKYYLNARQSKLRHLTSFGLMLATAEANYRELKLKKQGNREMVGTFDAQEIEVLLDAAVLRYLKRFNQLPRNVTDAFRQGVTLDQKKELAMSWVNSA